MPVTVTVGAAPTVVTHNPTTCTTADLTAATVTAGSTAGLTYTYFTDAAGTITLATPTAVGAGTYYIVGTLAAGCVSAPIPVTVTVTAAPTVVITNPGTVCAPATVDLTLPAVTAGSTAGLTFTYFTDAAGTITLATPTAVGAGTYYIVGTLAAGCASAPMPVTVTVGAAPTVVTHNPTTCTTADLTAAAVTAGSTAGLTYTYFTDAAGTITLATPTAVGAGTYYIVGTLAAGCVSAPIPVTVTVTAAPTVVITNPGTVCAPATVDITAAAITAGSTAGLTFTYFTDAAGTITLATPTAVGAGTYYIVGTLAAGCASAPMPVTVTVGAAPTVVIHNPGTVCAPATVDLTLPAVTAGSTAGLTFAYFTDAAGTITLATPTAVGAGTYYIVGKLAAGCASAPMPVTVTVGAAPTVVITDPSATCAPTVDLTLPAVTAGSTAGLTYTYFTDAAGTITLTTPTAVGAGTYYIVGTLAAGCVSAPMPVTVTVGGTTTPTFTQITPVCQNSTAPPLLTTSLNNITGTWTPAVINTTTLGPTTYTFTPNVGQCATTASMTVTITNQITPTFSPIAELCLNSPAPLLLTTSLNNITGTWNPATINTSALGSTLYTFTPNPGQCGATTTLNVTITDQITPTFAAIDPICQNSPAPPLPATSSNNITGTWNPATINTSTVGTSNYTFTPNPGQCGTTALLSVTITNQITPTFATIGPLCQNSTPPSLLTTSLNNITGAWNPATINTSTVGTSTYTFTPNPGQCGTITTLSITVATQITPAFDDIGPLCQNSTPPSLPLKSTNNITGTWNPATISTSAIGVTQYTFTPAAGQCGTTATLSIEVTDQITPTFDAVGPLCLNSTPPQLPNVSNNGITGSWSPTISTGTIGTTIYTFTPDAGQCGASTTLSISVTDQITPTFNAIGPFCLNSVPTALPLTSTNGIIGTWNPATINTSTAGTTMYTFTPNGGQCGIGFALNITVATQITPTFTQIGPLCQNSVAPTLPPTSIEGVTGTWSPASISTTAAGTTTYTFTPSVGQCSSPVTMDIVIGGPSSIAIASTNSHCINADGTVTLGTVTGGVGPYLYSFDGSGFTSTTNYTNLAARTYAVIVQDANGCTFNSSAVVGNSDGPSAAVVTSTNATCGNNDGTITIGAVTGGVIPYTYQLNGTGGFTTIPTFNNLGAGTYTIAVKDANGCIFNPTPVVIGTIGGPTVTITNPAATCAPGTVDITAAAITAGSTAGLTYTYFTDAAGTTPLTTPATITTSGNYYIVGTTAAGCASAPTKVVVTIGTGATAVVVTPTSASCGLNNGTINIGAVTGGIAPYTYDVNNTGIFAATTVYNNLAAGQYTVSVKDANGCIFTAPAVTIGTTGGPTVTITNPAPTCAPANVDITAAGVTAGSTAGLTYTYFTDAAGTITYTTPTAATDGTYYVVGTTAAGCASAPMPVVVTVRTGATAIAVAPTNAACGASNGSVTLGAVTGGTAPYLYNFDVAGFSATLTYNNLAAGNYTLVVQDANGCTFNAPDVNISNTGGATDVAVTPTDATCGQSNGIITIGNVTGGVAPYTYDLNNTGTFTSTTAYNNLAPGQYTVSVKDVNGCIFTAPAVTIGSAGGPTVTITNPAPVCAPATVDITAAAVTAGSTPGLTYTYFTDALATLPYATSAAATNGTYYIVGTTAAGCASAPMPVVVTVRNGPTDIAVAPTSAACGASNGSVTLGNVTGGTGPYLYYFNGGGFTSTTSYTNLAAGSYTLAVQDANGCIFNAPNVTISNSGGPSSVVITPADATCGQSDGSITIGNVTGGVAPYMYDLNSTGVFTATTVYNNLAAGSYTVSVKDINGCIFTAPAATIGTTGGPTVTITNPAATCAPATVDITAAAVTAGSTPGLTYTYFTDAAGTVPLATPATSAGGTYYIVGTTAAGCASAPMPVVVTVRTGATAIQATPTNAACGTSNGSVTLGTVTGGVAPYQYNFNGGGFSTTITYNNLAAGSYTLVVQDANGCIYNAPNVAISNTGGATAVVVTPTDATCGQSNGTITISNVTGGVGPYTYDLNNTGTFTATTVYNNLAAGPYTVSVKDANGCTFIAPVTNINTTGGPTVTITNPAPTCAPGTVDITAAAVTAGSTSGLTYTYFTDAAGTVPLATPAAITAGGTYYIVGKTAAGCSSPVMPVVVTVRTGATAIQVATTNAGCGASNGIVLLGNVTGGVAPYQYNFNGLGFSNTNTYNNLAAGSYTLVVQDANGCTFTAPNVGISNTGAATAVVVSPTDATCGQSNGTITIGNVTGGVAPYQYQLNTGGYSTTTVYNNLAAGQYTVSVKDVNGCIYTAPVTTINSTTNSITPLFNAIANVCQNSTAPTLPSTSTNGIAGTWSPAAINTALTGPNVYTFTPTGNPCAAPITLTVTVNAAPASTTKISVCPNQLPYTWNGQLYTEPGTFTQTFTQATGCDSIATMILTVDQTMTNERYPTITTTPNTATQLQARQLGSNFDYFWDPSVGLNSVSIYNPIFSFNQDTEYTISIVSDQGCKVTDTLLVKVNGSGPAGVASDLFVPNAWTPNGDGVNDRLFPLTENVTKLNYFRVFNRWGQLMFETSTIGDGWDGVFNGKPMMMDTYTWTAEAVGIDGKTFKRSGNAVLIR